MASESRWSVVDQASKEMYCECNFVMRSCSCRARAIVMTVSYYIISYHIISYHGSLEYPYRIHLLLIDYHTKTKEVTWDKPEENNDADQDQRQSQQQSQGKMKVAIVANAHQDNQ